MRPYVPHIETVLSHLPEKLFRNFDFRPRLVGMLKRHREYSDAVAALTFTNEPQKQKVVPGAAMDSALDCDRCATGIPRCGSQWPTNSSVISAVGWRRRATPSPRVAFFSSAGTTAVEADVPPVERARIRIHEAFALVKATPVEETRRLLEEGITLFEQQEGLVSFVSIDATDAVWLYAAVAHTPEQRTRAVGWLRQALPPVRKLLSYGLPHACSVNEQLVRLLTESGQIDEALAVCEETLGVAIRSRDLRRHRAVRLAPLWEQRGSTLRELGRFLAAARSYARCLALERRHEKPATLRLVGLLKDTGEMFRRAGWSAAAASRLLEAATLLDGGWTDEPGSAEILASLVGLALGRVERRSEGETLLRRSIASRCARVGAEHCELALLHRLLGVFLHEAERLPEAETELRHALVLAEKNSDPDNHSLLPALDSLATLLEDLQRHAEALPLRQRCLALAERNKRTMRH